MSTSDVDTRIVSMQFENSDFISKVKDTISKLKDLDEALVFKNAPSNLDAVGKQVSNVGQQVSNVGRQMQTVEKVVYKTESAFSALKVTAGIAMYDILKTAQATRKKLVNILYDPIANGGKTRALNIENAKFQIQGLGHSWASIEDDINYGVKDTAYGLDSAAKVAAQLLASGVTIGDDMKTSLRSISGVAAMTNSSYDEIGSIFTTIASNGKLMTQQLRQLSFRGLNAAAVLAKAFGKTEQEINDMVSKGKISFAEFAAAMDDAFGEHAKKANDTFTGAMSNVKAALARIGAKFAAPAFEDFRQILVQIIPLINLASEALDPLASVTEEFGDSLVGIVTELVETEAAGRALVSTMLTLYTWIRPFLYALVDSIGPVGGLADGLLGLSKSMENLQLSGENAMAVYWVFRQIFDFISDIVRGIGAFIKLLKPFGAVIRAVFTVAFVAFATLARLLVEAQPLLEVIAKLAVNIINIIGIGLAGAIYVIGELIAYIFGTGDAFSMLKNVASSMTGSVAGIKDVFSTLFNYIGAGLSSIAGSFDGIRDSTWKTVVAVALTIAGVTGMVILVIKAFSLLKKPVKKVASIGESVFSGIDDIVHGILSVTKTANKVLNKLGIAIIFAAIGYSLNAIVNAFKTMASLDWTAVKVGIPYILGAIALLGGFFALATVLVGNLKINVNAAGALLSGGMLISMSLLLWSFVGAFAALTAISWDRIKAAAPILAVGFAGLLYFLSILKAGMKATIAATPALLGMAAVMFSLGHAFISLSVSVMLLTLVDWDKLSDGYVVLGFAAFVVIALVGAMRSLAHICTKGGADATRAVAATSVAVRSIAQALFLMASSLGIFAISLQMLSKVNYDGLDGAVPWLIGFGTAMYLITVGLLYVCHNLEFTTRQPMAERINAVSPILKSISKSLMRLSFAIIPFAIGLQLLSKVDWDALSEGQGILLAISILFGGLAVFLTLFSKQLGFTTTRVAKVDKQLKYLTTRVTVHYGSLIRSVFAIAGVIVWFTFSLIAIETVLDFLRKHVRSAYRRIKKVTNIILGGIAIVAVLSAAVMIAVALTGGTKKILKKGRKSLAVNVNEIFKDVGAIVKSLSLLMLSVSIMFVAFTVMVAVLAIYIVRPRAVITAVIAFATGIATLTLSAIILENLIDKVTTALVTNKGDVAKRTEAAFKYLRSMITAILMLSAIVLVMEAAVLLISWLSEVNNIDVASMTAIAVQFFLLMVGLKWTIDSIFQGVEIAAKNFGNNYGKIIKSYGALAGVLISVAVATAGVTASIAYFAHVINECEGKLEAAIMPLVTALIMIIAYIGVLVFVISKFETVKEVINGRTKVLKSTNIADDALMNFSAILFRLALSIAIVEIGMLAVVAAGKFLGTDFIAFLVVIAVYAGLLLAATYLLKTLNTVSTFAVGTVTAAIGSVFSVAWKLLALGAGILLMSYLITLVIKSIANTCVAIMESASQIKLSLLWQFVKLLGAFVLFALAIAVVGLVLGLTLPLLLAGVSIIVGVSEAVIAMSIGIRSLAAAMTALGEAANNPIINDAVTGVVTIVDLLGQIGATVAGAGILGILTAVAGPLLALAAIGTLMLISIITLFAAAIVINIVANKIPEAMEKFVSVVTLLIDTLTSLSALLDPVYMDVLQFTSSLVILALFLSVAGLLLAIAGIGLAVGATLMNVALPLLPQMLEKLSEISQGMHGTEVLLTALELIGIGLSLGIAGLVLAVAGAILLVGSALAFAGVFVLALFVEKLSSIKDKIPDAMKALGLVALLILGFLVLSAPLLIFAIFMAVMGPLLAIGGLLLMAGMAMVAVAVMLMTPIFTKLQESIPTIEGATEALWALAKFGGVFLLVAVILGAVGLLLLVGGVALAVGGIALLVAVASLGLAVMLLAPTLAKLAEMLPLIEGATEAFNALIEFGKSFLIVGAILLVIGVVVLLAGGLLAIGGVAFVIAMLAFGYAINLLMPILQTLGDAIPLMDMAKAAILKLGEVALTFLIVSAIFAAIGLVILLAGGLIAIGVAFFAVSIIALAVIIGLIYSVASNLLPAIQSAFEGVVGVIGGIIDGIQNGFEAAVNAVSSFVEAGSNIVSGIVDGISSGIGSAVDAITDLGSSIVDGFCDLLDIHSPSEVFAGIGRFICEGLGIGIEDNSDTAVSAAEDMGSEAAEAAADAATEPSIGDRITGFFSDTFGDEGGDVVSAAEDMGSDAGNAAADAATKPSLWDRIVGFFSNTFGDAGRGCGFSIGEGFEGILPNLLDGFTSSGSACGNAFGNAFGSSAGSIMERVMGMTISEYGGRHRALTYQEQALRAQGNDARADEVHAQIQALDARAREAREMSQRFRSFSVDSFFGGRGGSGMPSRPSGAATTRTTDSSASAIAGSSGPGSGINDKSKMGSNNNINSNNTYNYVQNNYSPEPLDRTSVYMQTQRQLKSWGTWNRVHG